MTYVFTVRGVERAETEGNLFSLHNMLFMAKIFCVILCWKIANLTFYGFERQKINLNFDSLLRYRIS